MNNCWLRTLSCVPFEAVRRAKVVQDTVFHIGNYFVTMKILLHFLLHAARQERQDETKKKEKHFVEEV